MPPVNPSGHFFVERNVDRAEYRDDEQTELAKTLPQSQAYVSELHRHNFPRQRHPERRPPDPQISSGSARNGNRLEMFRFAQQDSAIYGARSSS